jgi:hypothetical protein
MLLCECTYTIRVYSRSMDYTVVNETRIFVSVCLVFSYRSILPLNLSHSTTDDMLRVCVCLSLFAFHMIIYFDEFMSQSILSF